MHQSSDEQSKHNNEALQIPHRHAIEWSFVWSSFYPGSFFPSLTSELLIPDNSVASRSASQIGGLNAGSVSSFARETDLLSVLDLSRGAY